MKIVKRSQLKHERLVSETTGEQYSFSAVLSNALQSEDFFIHHEIVPPGARASSPHCHLRTEEMVLVLEGKASVYEGDTREEIEAGDCALLHANSTSLHFVANETDSKIELIVITKKLEVNDTVVAMRG